MEQRENKKRKNKPITSVSAYMDFLKEHFWGKEIPIAVQTFEKQLLFLMERTRTKSVLDAFCQSFFKQMEKVILERVKVSDYGSKKIVSLFEQLHSKYYKKCPAVIPSLGKGLKQIKQAVSLARLEEDFVERVNLPFSQFFFRGHADKVWDLNPFLFRKRYDECFLYHEMQRLEPDAFKNNSVFDNLALMQHYGCPTRLLDVSFNPLVSLYFACNDKFEVDGKVFVFNRLNFANEDDANITAISKLALLTEKEKEDLKTDIGGGLRKKNGSYCRVMKESDLVMDYFLEPVLVKTKFLAPRIRRQAGAFAIAPLDGQNLDGYMRSICCEELVIPFYAKGDILKELDQMCINEYYLFDGLEHAAGYLKTLYDQKQNKE